MSVTVVTGGGKGIGAGIAEALRAQDEDVAIFDADVATRGIAETLGASFYHVDVTQPESLLEAFQGVRSDLGQITGLVNSAGLTRTGPSHELPAGDWRTVIDVDLSGTFYACQAAFEHLAAGASIVNIASIAATRALPGRVAYTAAKFGVVGVTRVLAVEWADRPIRVNAIGPAWTQTPFLDDLIAAGKLDPQALEAKIPMGRLAQVSDVVDAATFLLGPTSKFITGQTLYVDGGYTWAG